MRYIHRNPLRSGLADKLDQYPWISHKGYVSNAKKWDWLYKDFILSMLTPHRSEQIMRYKQFTAQPDSEEILQIFDKKIMPSVLGRERFIEWIKEIFFNTKTDKEVPESKSLTPDMTRMKETVCRIYEIEEKDLIVAKRETENEVRNVAIYLMRYLRCEPLLTIGSQFNLNRHSSVSSVLERTRKKLKEDCRFQKRIEKIEKLLTQDKSQVKT